MEDDYGVMEQLCVVMVAGKRTDDDGENETQDGEA